MAYGNENSIMKLVIPLKKIFDPTKSYSKVTRKHIADLRTLLNQYLDSDNDKSRYDILSDYFKSVDEQDNMIKNSVIDEND